MRPLAAIAALSLAGCASTRAFVGLQGQHASHLSQHFANPPTNYGYDAVEASFRIEHPGEGAFAEFDEGYILEPKWSFGGLEGAGAMIGPKELTQITIGYRWRVW